MKKKEPKVTYRQEGGDDGYSYVLRVDGRAVLNGLSQREARYEKDAVLRRWRESEKSEGV